MKNVYWVIGLVIDGIESELETKDKHVIKTDTIKTRALVNIELDCGNNDTEYCAAVGFAQVIQSCLYTRGYRSIGDGHFVNLDKCEDAYYLKTMLNNADLNVRDKQKAKAKIEALCDGQGVFVPDENGALTIEGVKFNLTPDELARKIEDDSI